MADDVPVTTADRPRLGEALGKIIAGARDHYRDKEKGASLAAAEGLVTVLDQVEALEAEITRLRHSLAYYASPDHYVHGDVPGHIYILDDDGADARQALGLPGTLADSQRYDVELQCRRIWRETL